MSGEKKKGSKSTDSSNDNKLKLIRVLSEGDYFGEIALLTNLKRTASVIAKDFTTLGFIVGKNFIQAKDEFPQLY